MIESRADYSVLRITQQGLTMIMRPDDGYERVKMNEMKKTPVNHRESPCPKYSIAEIYRNLTD